MAEKTIHRCIFLVCALGSVLLAQTASPEFSGPSILSRGVSPQRMSDDAVHVHFMVGVGAVYETDVTPFSITATGTVPQRDEYGLTANAAVDISHKWRRTDVSLGYRVGATHHPRYSAGDYLNQALRLSITHVLSRHWRVGLNEAAGTYSRIGSAPFSNPSDAALGLPVADYFDAKTYYFSNNGSLVYQPTPRWSFNMGGGEFITRYHSRGLIGSTGVNATGDAVYRVSRRTSIGANYQFSTFRYKSSFGDAYNHSVNAVFSRQLNRAWGLETMAGMYRSESTTLASVEVDPIITFLLGIRSATVVSNNVHYGLSARAQLNGTLGRNHHLVLGFTRGTHSGNGIYGTSEMTQLSANYGYSGLRTWGIGIGNSYVRLRALQQNLPPTESYHAAANLGRQIAGGLHASLTAGYSKNLTAFQGINRAQLIVSFSLAYSPRELPISIF